MLHPLLDTLGSLTHPEFSLPSYFHPTPPPALDNAQAPTLLRRAPIPRPVCKRVLIGYGPMVQPPGQSRGLEALRQPGLESVSAKGTGGLGLGARPARAAPPFLHKRQSLLSHRP